MAISFTRPRVVDFIGWALLATAVIFAVFVRVRLREFPFERDEGEFAYAGQLLLHGIPPYKLAYNMKLPGTYIAYSVLMAVFGQTTAGVHLGLLAMNIATILLLYRLTRELLDPFAAGMAAIVYSILSLSPALLGMAAHATHFVAFFALLGAYSLWRHLQSGTWWLAAASGLAMGLAFLMKQQGVFMMVFGGVVLLWLGLRSPDYPRRKLPLALAGYSFGAVLPYLLTCFCLWRAGVWQKFWFWTVEYASKYVQNEPLSTAPAYFWYNFSGIIQNTWPLWTLALAGAIALALRRYAKPGIQVFLICYVLFSFLCVCPGFYFRQHYFIVVLPSVAILAGLGCRLLWDLAAVNVQVPRAADAPKNANAGKQKRQQVKAIKPAQQPQTVAGGFGPLSSLVVMAIALAVGGTVWMQSAFYFKWPPLLACRIIYNGNPFLECPQIAEYLKAHTSPDDTIAVLGSEPEIYFDADRRSATGYIYTYGLMEEQQFAPRMQKEMIAEIEAAKPKYVVFANVRFSWLIHPQSDLEILDWAMKYLNANYEKVGVLEPRSPLETASYWDDQLQLYRPPTQRGELDGWKLPLQALQSYPYFVIFRRK